MKTIKKEEVAQGLSLLGFLLFYAAVLLEKSGTGVPAPVYYIVLALIAVLWILNGEYKRLSGIAALLISVLLFAACGRSLPVPVFSLLVYSARGLVTERTSGAKALIISMIAKIILTGILFLVLQGKLPFEVLASLLFVLALELYCFLGLPRAFAGFGAAAVLLIVLLPIEGMIAASVFLAICVIDYLLKKTESVIPRIVLSHSFEILYLGFAILSGRHSPMYELFFAHSPVSGIFAMIILAVCLKFAGDVLLRRHNERGMISLAALYAGSLFFGPHVFPFTVLFLWTGSFSEYTVGSDRLEQYEKNHERIGLQLQKNLQNEMLKDIKRVCEKNNLTFFLGGGTLLGAIRHHGYIPWDDDVDIMLPRDDYEKFARIYPEEGNPSFRYIDYRNNYGYYYSFGKVIDTSTRMYEFKFKDIRDLGLYIDVFPIEKMPDDDASVRKMFRDYRRINRWIYLYQLSALNRNTKNPVKKALRIAAYVLIAYFDVWHWLLHALERCIRRYETKDVHQVACMTGVYKERELMPASYIDGTVMVPFEGEMYAAPSGYDAYLTKHYGDYMKLPPAEQQVSRHDNKAFRRLKDE